MSMETAASVGEGAARPASSTMQLPRRSLGGLVAISIFWFAINFHWAALLLLLVPSQVVGLLMHVAPAGTLAARAAWVDQHKALTLALVEAPGLVVALIANPLFGMLSDRTPGRLGRRRPYILGGTALNIAGLLLMALLPLAFTVEGSGTALAPGLLILMAALMLTQLANNAAAAPFHALLPDLVPQEQRGAASGIMGLALFLGQIGGAVAPSFIGFNSSALESGTQSLADYDSRIVLAYVAVAVVIAVMAALTGVTVRERAWTRRELAMTSRAPQAHTGRSLGLTVLAVLAVTAGTLVLVHANIGLSLSDNTLSGVQLVAVVVAGVGAAIAFDFRPRRDPDFSWVVLTRMLVMMGVYMVQSFIAYYMQDVAGSRNPQADTTVFIVILTITALVSSLLAGSASDRFGRKRMVYVSGTFMSLVGAAFVLAPYLVPGHILALAFGAAAIFGLGYGAYVSVDWALVADVLPSEATYARDMGVWNIALTLPQVFAAILGGWLISLGILLGSKTFGYTLLFVWLVVFCVFGTVTVRFIKGVKR